MPNPNVVVIDYGTGNVRSVMQALMQAEPKASITLTANPKKIARASHVVLPGQGAMHECMHSLHQVGLTDVIKNVAATTPLMGVCVGMHMLFDHSDEKITEHPTKGLGIIQGTVHYLAEHNLATQKLKIPHMGWNQVQQMQDHALWKGVKNHSWFYFAHSLYVETQHPTNILGHTNYGIDFTCAVVRDNIVGVQFHPEKSANTGIILYKNFLAT